MTIVTSRFRKAQFSKCFHQTKTKSWRFHVPTVFKKLCFQDGFIMDGFTMMVSLTVEVKLRSQISLAHRPNNHHCHIDRFIAILLCSSVLKLVLSLWRLPYMTWEAAILGIIFYNVYSFLIPLQISKNFHHSLPFGNCNDLKKLKMF